MNKKLTASFMSGFKMVFWSAVSAGVIESINQLPHTNLPLFLIPIFGAFLKSVATYAATAAVNK